jgi:hypothetical protein
MTLLEAKRELSTTLLLLLSTTLHVQPQIIQLS